MLEFLQSISPQKLFLFAIILFAWGAYSFFKHRNSGGANITRVGGGPTPILNSYTVDLTAAATGGKIDPVIGRKEEIDRLTQILGRRTKNNAILLGAPGVGKTAIVEGLAFKIVTGDVPETLKGRRVLSLRISDILSGTKYRGEFEDRAKKLVAEIQSAGREIILFIDEIHTLMQQKGTEGSVNFSDILKPALARGELQLVGATTEKEYEEFVKPDASLERRFQTIAVDEPNAEETLAVLMGVRKNFEEYHKVRFTDESLSAAVRFAKKYIKDRKLPDKAIDVLDEAASMVRVRESGAEHVVNLLNHAAARAKEAHKNLPPEQKKLQEWPVVGVGHMKEVVANWIGKSVGEIK